MFLLKALYVLEHDILGSSRLRPGSKSFMVLMYSFQKLWLKTSTRNDIW